MKLQIRERRDYEMYVAKLVHKNIKMGDAMKKLLIKMNMDSFDSGIAFVNKELEVEI